MGRRLRMYRWIVGLSGAAVLLQTGSCALTAEQSQTLGNQFIVPQISTVLSDLVFFLLDNALVRLTT